MFEGCDSCESASGVHERTSLGRETACRGRGSTYRNPESCGDPKKHSPGRQRLIEANRVLIEAVLVLVEAVTMPVQAVKVCEALKVSVEAGSRSVPNSLQNV